MKGFQLTSCQCSKPPAHLRGTGRTKDRAQLQQALTVFHLRDVENSFRPEGCLCSQEEVGASES